MSMQAVVLQQSLGDDVQIHQVVLTKWHVQLL